MNDHMCSTFGSRQGSHSLNLRSVSTKLHDDSQSGAYLRGHFRGSSTQQNRKGSI